MTDGQIEEAAKRYYEALSYDDFTLKEVPESVRDFIDIAKSISSVQGSVPIDLIMQILEGIGITRDWLAI